MRKRLLIVTSILLILSSGVVGYLLLAKEKNPIPQSIQKSVSFPLYYPDKLPANWQIEKNSFNKNTDVVMYRISDKANVQKSISVSIQPQPRAFNFDKFYKETLAKSTQFTTDLGLAAIGEGENSYKIGSIATGDSWILASSSSQKVTNQDLRTILSSMKH